MTTETKATPAADTPAPAKLVPHITMTERGLEALKQSEKEIATYRRELPRLLEEGHIWRYALVNGDEVLSIWDTQSDAIQAGRLQFGLEPIFVKRIDPRDPERYAMLDAMLEAQCPRS